MSVYNFIPEKFESTPDLELFIFGVRTYDLDPGTNIIDYTVTGIVNTVIIRPTGVMAAYTYYIDNAKLERLTFDEEDASPVDYYIADVVSQSDYYPFGMLLPKRNGSEEDYRYGFNGMEKDDEVTGDKGTSYTTEFRQLDPRVGRWLSIDPKATAWESPYVSMGNSPIWFKDPKGDTIVVDNKGYVDRADRNEDGSLIDNLVFMKDSEGALNPIGELTSGVKADGWYNNLMKENAVEADGIYLIQAYTFRDNVAANGKWDYKNLNSNNEKLGTGGRKEHLLGIAFSLDKDTDFSFDGETYRSEDLNNHHFGIVGKAFGYFTEQFMLEQAGAAEMGKWIDEGKRVPEEWAPYRVVRTPDYINPGMSRTTKILLPPYGDNPVDHEMIKKGFAYYDQNKSKGTLD